MEHKFQIEQTGIMLYFHEDWPRLSKSMSIREINFILRAVYIIVLMTMQRT